MKLKTMALVAAVVVITGAVAADANKIGMYIDESGSDCNLLDSGAAVHYVYVIYSGPAEITASEFQVQPQYGAELTYVGEEFPYANGGSMGRADTGVGVAFGGECYGSPALILKVIYHGLGVSETCGSLKILSDPRSVHQNGTKILFLECETSAINWAEPGHITINPDDDCECDADADGGPSPVASTTWGGIKAMYVD
jgi:hypothetical protein